MNTLERVERSLLRKDAPRPVIGNTVKVYYRIKEGDKSRIQVYEGVVIRIKGGSIRETFTVRKTSYGIGVERIFPIHSPLIEKIEVVREGRVRRAKLYYLRSRTGRAARIPEKARVFESSKKNPSASEKVSAPDETPALSEEREA